MIEIKLTQEQITVVDDIDEDLAQYNWYASWNKHTKSFYAVRNIGKWPNQQAEYLHRVIMERILGRKLEKHEKVDHIHHNTLDNRRSELRLVSNQQNIINARKATNKSSQYKGVSWHKQHSKWRTQIRLNNKLIHLSYFIDEIEAARAYDRAALHYFEEFAWLNFPEEKDLRLLELKSGEYQYK